MFHVLVIEDEPLIADYVAALAEMAGATSSEKLRAPEGFIIRARFDR